MRNGLLMSVCVAVFGAMATAQTLPASAPTNAPAIAPASAPTSVPAIAPAPASVPAAIPAAAPATVPASAPAVDPAALKILQGLEDAGKKYDTIQADITYLVRDPKLGDEETRTGYVMYQKETAGEPARFRIHFDTLRMGDGPKVKEVVDYAFDGQWLWIAEHANKKLRKLQVAAPGERVEPLRLGKGPFPLPFGQKVDEVLKYFQVSTRATAPSEPKDTQYLKLVPQLKYTKEMNFVELQMWIDPSLQLPLKIISRESNKMVTTVHFAPPKGQDKIVINKPFGPENFSLEIPIGWKLEITPLDKDK